MKLVLMFTALISAANAAILLEYPDAGTKLESIEYRIFVNNGGNQQAAGTFLNGNDPATLTHTASTAGITDGLIVDAAELDLTLITSLTSQRQTSYFSGVPSTATWNPTFAATQNLTYSIFVSSSAGSEQQSFTYSSAVSNLNLLSLGSFASLLDASATGRAVTISWQDVVDFTVPANMAKNNPVTLPGTNNPEREYRWNVSAGVSQSNTNLSLTLSEQVTPPPPPPPPPPAVPEPGSMFLLGSGLLGGVFFTRRFKR